MAAPRAVPCPQCGRTVEWTESSRWRPFCSERCKLIDLGAWAAEEYRIPLAESPDPGDKPSEDPAGDESRKR